MNKRGIDFISDGDVIKERLSVVIQLDHAGPRANPVLGHGC